MRAGIATESELLSQQQVHDYYEVGGRIERRRLVSLLGGKEWLTRLLMPNHSP